MFTRQEKRRLAQLLTEDHLLEDIGVPVNCGGKKEWKCQEWPRVEEED